MAGKGKFRHFDEIRSDSIKKAVDEGWLIDPSNSYDPHNPFAGLDDLFAELEDEDEYEEEPMTQEEVDMLLDQLEAEEWDEMDEIDRDIIDGFGLKKFSYLFKEKI